MRATKSPHENYGTSMCNEERWTRKKNYWNKNETFPCEFSNMHTHV